MTGEKVEEAEIEENRNQIHLKELEAVVFIPATLDSKLRKSLQEIDEVCKATGSLTVIFVKKGGPTVLDQVERNNPWGSQWFCPRGNCLPCNGRLLLAMEEKEETDDGWIPGSLR